MSGGSDNSKYFASLGYQNAEGVAQKQSFERINARLNIDANLNVGYRVNDQLSIFAKGNNLLGNSYQAWANYPVQGLQVLGGVTYKFNY